MTRPGAARLAGLVLAAATGSLLIAGTVLILLFVERHPGELATHLVVPLFYNVPLVLAFTVVSAVVLSRLPEHPVGWLFGVVGFSIGVGYLAEGYAAWDLPGLTWTLWIWNVLTGVTFFGLAMGVLLFPTGRPASPRWRWLARLLWGYVAASALVTGAAPWPRQDEFLVVQVLEHLGGWPPHNPVGWHSQAWLSDVGALVSPVGALLLLASLLSLLPRWRRAGGDERQQIKWLGLAGLLATLVLFIGLVQTLTEGVPPDDPTGELVGNAIFVLIIAGIPLATGVAIVRYRLYDIDVVINRTLVYGGLVAFIGLAYVVGVVATSELVSRRGGSSTVVALTVTAVVAVAFQPLRTNLQARADQWVFGHRAAPYELMARFGHELGQAVVPSEVLARIAQTAGQAVRADAAHVRVTLPDGEPLAAHWPAASPVPASFDLVVPVHYEGTAIGEISVAGGGNRGADLALLQRAAAVSAAALRNLRLLAELESVHETIQRQNRELAASRRRLVAAAQAERQRLERLVAQRLGPGLETLRMSLPALAATGQPPDALREGCARATSHATQLVDEIRALSRGVLPPLLADHGLAAALRALLRRLDVVATLEIAPSIGSSRFPALVETTAYLCCRAALEAAASTDQDPAQARTGQARSQDRASRAGTEPAAATLKLWRTDGALAFSISFDSAQPWTDDLAALRERVVTVGGELTVVPGDDWHTIAGTVPIEPPAGQA
jgi:signal transduction histidine kinase